MTEPEAGTTGARLWQLLPAVYRLRDGEAGGVLAELLDVFGDQVDVLAEELAQLYDDQFIETAAPWATPYIGGVVGYRVIHGVVPEVVSPRAEVANTIAYRRRKGTAAVIEQLARDVTGWPARAVESFERLATTQYMNHVRVRTRRASQGCATTKRLGTSRSRRRIRRPGAHRRTFGRSTRRGGEPAGALRHP